MYTNLMCTKLSKHVFRLYKIQGKSQNLEHSNAVTSKLKKMVAVGQELHMACHHDDLTLFPLA